MGRLLIVSNRLPMTVTQKEESWRVVPSVGGLATALGSIAARLGGGWFGWPGDLNQTPVAERERLLREMADAQAVPIQLTAHEVKRYYDGFSNGVLWPLFHYMLYKVRLDSEAEWVTYEEVNRRFAEVVASHYREGDLIWVHDYQLMLVPGMLRAMLPRARIGFFLHIPFPSADVFRILPWREQVLRGVLGADVLGFHTAGYRHNFAMAAAHVLGAEPGNDGLEFQARRVKLGVYPIGIDAENFASAAGSPEVEGLLSGLLGEARGKKIILGVDRLDYTKGVPRRLLAVERLLERSPELRHRLLMVQLAVPTRESVEAYAELRRGVNELVGRINSRFGTPTGSPLQMLYRALPFHDLVALYRAADVMLVTPLRDGMNLVAKEYVASRVDEQGVLVLSEFAGAAAELQEALIVNPYDVSGVAQAIQRAIEMPPDEQRLRMGLLREQVMRQSVERWADEFLGDMGKATGQIEESTPAGLLVLREHMKRLRQARRRVLFLDYDGTLVKLAPLPEMATPPPALLSLLRRLSTQPGSQVHLVSGRPHAHLETWFGSLPIGLHAEHGYWSRPASGAPWVAARSASLAWRGEVRSAMLQQVERIPGSFVEEKTSAMAFHFRNADPVQLGEGLLELRDALGRCVGREEFAVLEGKKVIEVRLTGVHKGLVVSSVLASETGEGLAVLGAGDDATDEELFQALPLGATSIKVGEGRTQATFRVEHPGALCEALEVLLGQ